jgi:hypothetical protein
VPKNPANESEQAPLNETARIVRALESAEIQRRLTDLENKVGGMENSAFDRHSRLITIIFSCMAAFLTGGAISIGVLAFLSKNETRDATNEMKAKVNDAVADISNKFQALAGDALKKPVAVLFYNGAPLENQIVEVAVPHNVMPAEFTINTLSLKNIGDKRTGPLSIKIELAGPFDLYGNEWDEGGTSSKQYQRSFYSKRVGITISPGEPWGVQPLPLQIPGYGVAIDTNFAARIVIDYGGERPAEAHFSLRLK